MLCPHGGQEVGGAYRTTNHRC